MLITGLRITGGAFFLGAGLGSLFTDGLGPLFTADFGASDVLDDALGALDVEEDDLEAPDAEDEGPDGPLAFCWVAVFFSGSDLRTSAAFF